MSKAKYLLYFFSGLFCLQLTITSCNQGANDQSTLESHLANFSTALAKADTATLRNLCDSNFVLLDQGKIYDLRQLITSIQSVLDSNSMTRKPVDPKITINKDVAWAYYKVSGEFVTKTGTIPLSLLESVVFDRKDGVWKISLVTTMPTQNN
jgi:hypothetical protein